MKQIEVTIMGHGYRLAVPEDAEALLQAAVASVDREMNAIRDAGKVKARERIAVLAALNIAYQMVEREGASRTARPAADAGQPAGDAALAPALEAEIDALLARLDQALSEDGQLL